MNPDLEGASCNEEAARLLPWYVVRRLSPADTERVSRHLEHCAVCRSDLAYETAVRVRLSAEDPVEYAPQAGLARTLSRIDELGRDDPASAPVRPPRPPRPDRWSARPRGAIRWLTAAVVLQALTLGWLVLFAGPRAPSTAAVTGYVTLSSDLHPSTGPHLRAVFAPALSMAELRALLAADHLTVVDGPSEAGAFTLTLDPGTPGATLEPTISVLRRDPRVLFVEPAVNDPMPPP